MSVATKFFAADDWGLSPAINEGILQLATRGVLRSVSCMATAPYLTHRLEDLLASAGRNQMHLSLHLNLTYGKPLSAAFRICSLVDPATGNFLNHSALIKRCLLGRIKSEDVHEEVTNQVAAVRRFGIPVRSLDGHHHVHLLPGIVGPLQEALPKLGIYQMRVLCDPRHPFSFFQTYIFKNFFFRAQTGIRLLPCLYLMPGDLRTAKTFRARLAQIGGLPLLTHPALFNDFQASGMTDSLRGYRVFEFAKICGYLDE